MAWQKTEHILNKRLNQHGLAGVVQAGLFCTQAEALYPGLFRAVSVRQTSQHVVLHLELQKRNHLAFKLIEGQLLQQLAAFSQERRLPAVTRIRLTFGTE